MSAKEKATPKAASRERQEHLVKQEAASAEGHSGAATANSPKQECRFTSLPRGLVGTQRLGQDQIKGNHFNFLLFTGSQVTTVPHSFYNTYLSDHEIRPLKDLLENKGANGQSVPYLGYIEINMTFPPDFLGSTTDVNTLALVVSNIEQPCLLILVGTNTLDFAYKKHCDTYPDLSFLPTTFGYQAVHKTLPHCHTQSLDDHYTPVTLHFDHLYTIYVVQTTVLEGFLAFEDRNPSLEDRMTAFSLLQGEKAVIIEHPASSPLPGRLMVKSCHIDLPHRRLCHLPIVVTNESYHVITIPP